MIINREIRSSYHHKPKVQGVDYSPFIMETVEKSLEKMERLMKRCSPEWRRRPAAAHGGGGPWGRRRLPLVMRMVWRRFSSPRRLPGRRKIRGHGCLSRPRVSFFI